MSAREHVFKSLAGPDVPVRHSVILHHVELFLAEYAVLSYDLHDLECISVREALFDEEVHDIVTARDDLVNGRRSVPQEILGIVGPYVGTV